MKLFQNIKSFIQIITNLLEKYQNKEIKSEKTRVKLEIFAKLISQITFGIAIIYYSMEVIGHRMDIGTYTFMIASIATFKDAVSGLTITLARQYADNMFVTDTFELLSLQPFIVSPINAIPIDSKKINIEFKNVSFQYPETEKIVLKNFNLRINHGDKIAIIGVNGAGKTTLIKLLCRFYDPTEGEILINGINLKNINLENWYSKLGALFQDFERYYFTTKQLISLGDTEKLFKMSRIKSSAKLSGAHDFISEWPNKYDQMMGKNFSEGVEPSVGQWQKLALARTYYRDPKIMILDEPTASIDAEAEAKIFNELNRTTKNKTVILISHRFSTVRNADKICVIKDGKLAEYGSHKQLIKLNKTYARLFNLQAKGYK